MFIEVFHMKSFLKRILSFKLPLVMITCILVFIFFIGILIKDTLMSLIYTSIIVMVLIMAIIYFENRSLPKNKLYQETMVLKPYRRLAKLILPGGLEILVKDYELILGRDDFIGSIPFEKLVFIGKKHFKLYKLDDGFYIEDMDSKNGTMVNGSQIKDLGKIKLKNNDEISIANISKIIFFEINSNGD
jgi:FHA domain